jgi:curved DNA-binding protein
VGYRDHYAVLGLSRDASADEIKRVYRKLARRFHPDVSREPDAEDRFKEINEAYDILGDEEKRRLYDRYGDAWKAVSEGRVAPPGAEEIRREYRGADIDPEQFADLGSLFDELFGGAFGPRARAGAQGARWQAAGPDLETALELTLEEAYRGGDRELRLVDPTTGASRRYDVRIPPGVRDGQRIRLAGQGGKGLGGGATGDLFLRVVLRPGRTFRFEGDDLVTPLRLAPWEAALGASVAVRTPDGPVRIRVPAGSSSGRRIRLRGKGYPRRGGARGDLYAEVRIVVPREMSPEERELYEKLSRVTSHRPRCDEERS